MARSFLRVAFKCHGAALVQRLRQHAGKCVSEQARAMERWLTYMRYASAQPLFAAILKFCRAFTAHISVPTKLNQMLVDGQLKARITSCTSAVLVAAS
jgi:hypothetical protein